MTGRLATARSQAGFTLVEMMVSTAVMMVIVAGVFSLLNPTYGTFQAQPEVSERADTCPVTSKLDCEGSIWSNHCGEVISTSGGISDFTDESPSGERTSAPTALAAFTRP